MIYTVSDFYNTYKPGLRLIAGGGGLSRPIERAGILDYELQPELKNKYFHTNFQPNQLVLATFLYAKESPYLITDAVKHLVIKGAAGLAIKNVFRLPMPEAVLRYADSKNFPIFIIDSSDIYFEEVIYTINRQIEELSSLTYVRRELDRLLTEPLSAEDAIRSSLRLNPSLSDQHQAFYLTFDDFFSENQFSVYAERFAKSKLNTAANFFSMYKNGILFLCCAEGEGQLTAEEDVLTVLLEEVLLETEHCAIGISNPHYYLGELKQAITESIHAALLSTDKKQKVSRYRSLGLAQILLPFCQSTEMSQFSQQIMGKLEDYDAENSTRLTETLKTFCHSSYSIAETANTLSQHENTIRYRLDKIHLVTGLDYKKPGHLEQLSAACKIQQCRETLSLW